MNPMQKNVLQRFYRLLVLYLNDSWSIDLTPKACKEAHIGFSYGYHDSAVAAIGGDGQILFAAHEERYSRIKHDNRFPIRALNECISYLGKSVDIKSLNYYEKSDLKEARKLDLILKNLRWTI